MQPACIEAVVLELALMDGASGRPGGALQKLVFSLDHWKCD